jgi:hypothetical protein
MNVLPYPSAEGALSTVSDAVGLNKARMALSSPGLICKRLPNVPSER